MSRHNRPARNASHPFSRQDHAEGKKEQMLPVSLYELTEMTRALEGLLGTERVATLSMGEIFYLTSLAHEELLEVPDDIAALLACQEARQFAKARRRLAMCHPRRKKSARKVASSMLEVRKHRQGTIIQSSLFDDDMLVVTASAETLLS